MTINTIQRDLLKWIYANNQQGYAYVDYAKKLFPINTLCSMLEIDRNRYYYLKNNGQLDLCIFALFEEVLNNEKNEQDERES